MSLILKYRKWGVYWTKNNENWTIQVQVTPFWTLMCISWPLTFIPHFKVYRTCVLGQSSVCNVILIKVTPLLTLNLYRQPISIVGESHVPCITLEAFSISFSIISTWFILHSFAWQPIWSNSFTQLTLYWVTQVIYDV